MKLIMFIIQISIVFLLVFWAFTSNQKIDFYWDGIIFTSSTNYILLALIIFIFLILLIQRIYLFIRYSPKRFKSNIQIKQYQKGIVAITKSLTAIANNDDKELISQTKKIDDYIKDNPISLVLRAESARKKRNFILAEDYYNKMLLNPNTKILGLRGLLEQNMKSQDYHHALIYAEKIFNINYKLEWAYPTIIEILVKTQNWQKMIEINNDAFNKKIISKNDKLKSNAIAFYEIALIKEDFSIRESLNLLSNANLFRPNFAPITKKYINLLIKNNQISKAKNLLMKTWSSEPHLMFFDEIQTLIKNEQEKASILINKIVKNNPKSYESLVLISKGLIIEKKWDEAKNIVKELLTSRPNETICDMMAEIELGLSGNEQKANSWRSRAKLGDLEKTWVCKHSGYIQKEWSSINQNGFFDSLEWTWPKNDIDNSKKTGSLVPNFFGAG